MATMDIEWPANEPVPQSIEDALKRGWEVIGNESELSEDERFETGVDVLQKHIGRVRLELKIPFKSEKVHGRPYIDGAFISIPDDIAEQLESLEVLASEQRAANNADAVA